MVPDFGAEAGLLRDAISERLNTAGASTALSIFSAAEPVLIWLDYLVSSEATGHSDDFLDGLRASIVETVGCGACGLVRPSLYSMRTQIDIVFSWLYFKDHPVEWAKVENTGEGFILKRDSIEYLKGYVSQFDARFSALSAKRTRQQQDPYKLLSAYVHAQGISVLPTHGQLETLVESEERCGQLALIQRDVSEYVNDILLSCFGPKWASLPESLVSATKSRLEEKQISIVFS